jgi:hypothetical protein
MPCTHRRPVVPHALHDERLGPGRSAAPDEDRLVLLPSGPDTVRGSSLRGTRSSTSLEAAACKDAVLGWEFSPAGADCRFRAPLVPRLARPGQSIRDDFTARSTGTVSAESRPRGREADIGEAIGARFGGEGGIRTRDGLPRTAFPVRRHSPLGDLSPERTKPTGMLPAGSGDERWRRGRDSNPRCFRTPLFESGTINHSDTSPRQRIAKVSRRADRTMVPASCANRGSRIVRRSRSCPPGAPLPRRDGSR